VPVARRQRMGPSARRRVELGGGRAREEGTAAKSSIGDGGIPTMLGILPARAASAAEAP